MAYNSTFSREFTLNTLNELSDTMDAIKTYHANKSELASFFANCGFTILGFVKLPNPLSVAVNIVNIFYDFGSSLIEDYEKKIDDCAYVITRTANTLMRNGYTKCKGYGECVTESGANVPFTISITGYYKDGYWEEIN